MRLPQVIVWEADGWMARQLRELAAEHRWLLRPVRSAQRIHQLLSPPDVCAVCLIQFEPWADRREPLELIAQLHRSQPDVAVVAVSDVKLSEAERSAWTAALFDLGARYVLFPPLTRPVLEDLVSGLMLAVIRRTVGVDPALTSAASQPAGGLGHSSAAASDHKDDHEPIDLVDEDEP
ncbi:MAG: hypothetical protein NZ703_04380 [Gemmataceae bacterium]|nr:hypothetical protein [Gemmataceae bacterium]MCS7270300.1 hypothetical protein [Gemmataceae bacterium]MDW8243046.1 hypothetical protein [Thermogemmata sp.]